jgi:hypothetical protein
MPKYNNLDNDNHAVPEYRGSWRLIVSGGGMPGHCLFGGEQPAN